MGKDFVPQGPVKDIHVISMGYSPKTLDNRTSPACLDSAGEPEYIPARTPKPDSRPVS